ncbi:uncharacterized protein F4807DRAFT_463927 [Annulohypoxylon truncatum]|uniref:uncharacterized protein n=1 Tax=Annulohypoxylon truncatum TaxID=327061 RepID=UPI0020080B4D|nr:uncharacterized protein F4807DRAFT_463927 [Annulohypoxylon truncatum]KAI1206160.1 hypothetical protein F4807DRAFT_463927 [Annulohypoxylon truncatum]
MKTSAILISVGAAMVAAQDITYPSGFPDCGKTCINNMLNQASDLGCTNVAPSCLCAKPNFIYGVRDCATESCQDQSLAQQVIQYGSQYCASVGVDVSGIPTATGTNPTASTTVVATASPTNNPIVGSQGSNSNGATGSVPISTATFETSFTASGSAVESTVTSTIFSGEASSSGTAVSGSESASESGSSTASVIASTITTNGSTLTTTASSTEAASSQASESGSSESRTGSASESASSTSNPAAQRTAAPAGFIAAAGLAALMLDTHP